MAAKSVYLIIQSYDYEGCSEPGEAFATRALAKHALKSGRYRGDDVEIVRVPIMVSRGAIDRRIKSTWG